ncbi:TPA: hypothetical protein L7T61_002076 [Klebsiella pneumoniae]|nr:hypothetical protein [Klebsiella pneumoniae]HBQ8776019.1 hypothetical protein [Klebsiella pneumoniae]
MSEFSRETLLNIIETDHVQCGEASALARMALAAMDSEPVAWNNGCNKSVPAALRYLAENPRPIGGESSFNTAHLYQLAREIELMAEATLYRHAQPAPVVPENCVTAEHRRVIEMLLNVCGAAFELADDSCQQDVDGEECHVVPSDAFQKLSDALDEIENTLPTEDIDRPDVFLAWSAMPRAALKSLLHAQPAPVVPELRVDWQENEFSAGWNACRAAMLAAAQQEGK